MMILLRFLFRTVLLWIVTKLLGRFFPILKRLLQLIFR